MANQNDAGGKAGLVLNRVCVSRVCVSKGAANDHNWSAGGLAAAFFVAGVLAPVGAAAQVGDTIAGQEQNRAPDGAAAGERTRPWTYSANTDAHFTYSDNVLLSDAGGQGDLVTTLSAGAQILGKTRRSSVEFDYQLDYDFYLDTDGLDGFRHSLLTRNSFVLARDVLFVDVNGSVREGATTRNLQTPATPRTINGDQTMVLTGSISPYLDTTIKGRIGVTSRLEFSGVHYINPDVHGALSERRDDNRVAASYGLKSLDRGSRIGWGVDGRFSRDDDDYKQGSASGLVHYSLSDRTRLLLRGGYDRTEGRRTGADVDDAFWRLGVEMEPARDAYIRFEAGERFAGPSYDAMVRYDVSPLLKISGLYSEAFETDLNRFSSQLNSLEPVFLTYGRRDIIYMAPGAPYFDPAFDPQFDGDGVEEATLTKTARATLSGAMGHVGYSVTGSSRRREFETIPGVIGGPFDEETVSGSINIFRTFGRRTELGVNGRIVDVTSDLPTLGFGPMALDLGREIDSRFVGAYGSYQVSKSVRGRLSFSWSEREDSDAVVVAENAVMLSLFKTW